MIKYQGVTIEREAQTLFENIDFRVEEGEFIYLIGKVGTGKSSLLKTIYAELPVTEGYARVFDYDLRKMKRSQIPYLRRSLGIIFQDFQLLTDRTVYDNLEFVLKATGWKSRDDRDERIKQVLALVGMETKAWRMPNTLSGGEQQRIVIARALLNKPKVILADEPTGNLDPETGHNIVALLHDICQSQNTAVVMSTHNLKFIEEFPGRVFKVENRTLKDLSADDNTSHQAEAEATDEDAADKSDALYNNVEKESTSDTLAEEAADMTEEVIEPTDQDTSESTAETQTDPADDSSDSNR